MRTPIPMKPEPVARLVPPSDPVAAAWERYRIAYAAFLENPTPDQAAHDRVLARNLEFSRAYLPDESPEELNKRNADLAARLRALAAERSRMGLAA